MSPNSSNPRNRAIPQDESTAKNYQTTTEPGRPAEVELSPETADRLGTYADLLAAEGLDSPSARQLYDASRHLPYFEELAQECRDLEEQFRGSQLTAPAAPGWRARGGTPRSGGRLLPFGGVAAAAALLMGLIGTATYSAHLVNEKTREVSSYREKLAEATTTSETAVAAATQRVGAVEDALRKSRIALCVAYEPVAAAARDGDYVFSPAGKDALKKAPGKVLEVFSEPKDIGFLKTWALKKDEPVANRGAVRMLADIAAAKDGRAPEAVAALTEIAQGAPDPVAQDLAAKASKALPK